MCNWFSTSAGVLSGAHRVLLWCCTPTSDDDDIRLCGNQKRMGQQKRAALQILGILFLAVAAVLAMSFPPRFPPPCSVGNLSAFVLDGSKRRAVRVGEPPQP